jgi:hypothetical protein
MFCQPSEKAYRKGLLENKKALPINRKSFVNVISEKLSNLSVSDFSELDLAPRITTGCQGVIGPVPLPFLIACVKERDAKVRAGMNLSSVREKKKCPNVCQGTVAIP